MKSMHHGLHHMVHKESQSVLCSNFQIIYMGVLVGVAYLSY